MAPPGSVIDPLFLCVALAQAPEIANAACDGPTPVEAHRVGKQLFMVKPLSDSSYTLLCGLLHVQLSNRSQRARQSSALSVQVWPEASYALYEKRHAGLATQMQPWRDSMQIAAIEAAQQVSTPQDAGRAPVH